MFGIRDLPDLLSSSQLVAHKLYLDYEPAAFFCLCEKIRMRSLDLDQSKFKGLVYSQLPQVQLSRDVDIGDVKTTF